MEYQDDRMKIPFYLTYPMENFYLMEMEYEKDVDRMKTLYPKEVQELLSYVERHCDNLEFEGSRIYDENPDREMMAREVQKIYEAVVADGIFADSMMSSEEAISGSEMALTGESGTDAAELDVEMSEESGTYAAKLDAEVPEEIGTDAAKLDVEMSDETETAGFHSRESVMPDSGISGERGRARFSARESGMLDSGISGERGRARFSVREAGISDSELSEERGMSRFSAREAGISDSELSEERGMSRFSAREAGMSDPGLPQKTKDITLNSSDAGKTVLRSPDITEQEISDGGETAASGNKRRFSFAIPKELLGRVQEQQESQLAGMERRPSRPQPPMGPGGSVRPPRPQPPMGPGGPGRPPRPQPPIGPGGPGRPSKPCRDNWLCNMIGILFQNELYRRRCRHRRCERWW